MTRHRPTEERRRQILDAARTCILEGGFQSTRVQEIAEAAGLSKGAVYFHFESKRALLEALLEDEFERAARIFDEVDADAGGQPLATAARAFVAFLGEPDDPRHRLFLLTGEIAVHDDALRARILEHHRALLGRLTLLLEGLNLPDAEALAVLLKAMADGLQAAWSLGHTFDRGRLLAAALALLGGGLNLGGA